MVHYTARFYIIKHFRKNKIAKVLVLTSSISIYNFSKMSPILQFFCLGLNWTQCHNLLQCDSLLFIGWLLCISGLKPIFHYHMTFLFFFVSASDITVAHQWCNIIASIWLLMIICLFSWFKSFSGFSANIFSQCWAFHKLFSKIMSLSRSIFSNMYIFVCH